MSRLIGISRSKYRVAVSDILPYERPIFFTNRFFVRFLKNYGVVCRDGRLIATKNQCEGLDEMLAILGGVGEIRRPAFQYTIAKSSTESGRRLTVIHPFHQVAMIEFYDRFKYVIADFCQRSHYSIRFPYKVAVVQKVPKGFPKYISDKETEKEQKNSNHLEESIKHFFAYRYYHNINDFYDDYRFLRAEMKFALMEKTDLEHCFDSIRPDMLSQAMFGCTMDSALGTMPYYFYQLNRAYENRPEKGVPGEGIVIGPEFSRIYAEIILQQVDVECKNLLEQHGVILNQDYVFYRYVDDGFLFCNKQKTKDLFNEIYETCLSKYGLKRNIEKMQIFDTRPFAENLTAGKLALINLFDSKFENRLETFKGFLKIQGGHYDVPTVLDSKAFIQSVRAILKTYGLKFKEVMSFILGVMNKRVSSLLSDFNKLYKQYSQAEYIGEISEQGLDIKKRYECGFLEYLNNLAEILFYFFSCDPRMSTSIKVVGIINQLQLFVRGQYIFSDGGKSAKFNRYLTDRFDERITDLTQRLFSNVTPDSTCVIETLNFLETQKCMSTAIQIHPRRIYSLFKSLNQRYVHLKKCDLPSFIPVISVWKTHIFSKNDFFKWAQRLNFFSACQFLHYIRNDERYGRLKNDLMEWIEKKVSCLWQERLVSDTEAVLVLFETLCCPWVEGDVKKKLISGFTQFDDKTKAAIISFASKQKDMFVKWRNYSIFEEMQHINNTEVY